MRFLSNSLRSRWVREVRLFWIKDTLASAIRDPLREIRTHGVLLTLLITTTSVLTIRLQGRHISIPMGEVGLSAILMGVSAILAMRSTLGRLGVEGHTLTYLRLILSPRRIFALKTATSVMEAVLLTSGYSLIMVFLTSILGTYRSFPLHHLIEGIAWGGGLAFFGSILGFLLPDFRRRSLTLPGSSISGKIGFTVGTGASGTCYLLGRGLYISDLIDLGTMLFMSALSISLLLGATLLLLPLVLRSNLWRES